MPDDYKPDMGESSPKSEDSPQPVKEVQPKGGWAFL